MPYWGRFWEKKKCLLILRKNIKNSIFQKIKDGVDGVDYSDKTSFNWISVIRLPDFVTQKNFEWAVETASTKKIDCSSAEFFSLEEGWCVQIMHNGSYDDEPVSVKIMDDFIHANGYENDISKNRLHHESF